MMLGSLAFNVVLFTTVVPYSLGVVFMRLFSREVAYRVAVSWARLIARSGARFCGLSFTLEGSENLPARSSVVLMKHSSAYETIIQMLLFPPQCWVFKHELMWVPFLGWGLASLTPIAIDRKGGHGAVAQVVEQGQARLAAGLWVVIFPEGTRMPPGETRRYGISGALLAQKAGCMLVPVAHNAGDFWARRGWLKRRGTVRFCVGPPVDPANRDPREVNEEIQCWIEGKVAELRQQS
jgi:1-acyl-sn-glycerol-3-phosphate acyltransferase